MKTTKPKADHPSTCAALDHPHIERRQSFTANQIIRAMLGCDSAIQPENKSARLESVFIFALPEA